jgi:hypothetical protein
MRNPTGTVAAQLATNPLHAESALGLLGLVTVKNGIQSHFPGPDIHLIRTGMGRNSRIRYFAHHKILL